MVILCAGALASSLNWWETLMHGGIMIQQIGYQAVLGWQTWRCSGPRRRGSLSQGSGDPSELSVTLVSAHPPPAAIDLLHPSWKTPWPLRQGQDSAWFYKKYLLWKFISCFTMKLIAVWVIGFFGTKTVESAGLHLFGIRITVDGFHHSSSRVEAPLWKNAPWYRAGSLLLTWNLPKPRIGCRNAVAITVQTD